MNVMGILTRRRLIGRFTCGLVAPLVVSHSVWALAESPAGGEDEDAIRKVIAQTTKAFNDHDAVAFAGFYTPDADLVTVRGESMKGTAEIQRTLTGIFQARAKHASLKPVDTRVRFIRPDVAVAHVINELSGLVDSDGRALPAHRELSIRVFVKEKGSWRVTAFHNTMLSRPSINEVQGTKPAPATEPER